MNSQVDFVKSELLKLSKLQNSTKNQIQVSQIQELEAMLDSLKQQCDQHSVTEKAQFEACGDVTQKIVDLYQDSYSKHLLAPSPIELLHNQLADFHVIKASKLYQETQSKMLRSRSVGRSQLSISRVGENSLEQTTAGLGDILTQYGEMTGYKLLIPRNMHTNFAQIYKLLTSITPKLCLGITVDNQQAAQLFTDAEIVPKLIEPLQFQVIFQRAVFLQTQLFENYTQNNENSLLSEVVKNQRRANDSFHYAQVKRLCYAGFILLIYAVAQHTSALVDNIEQKITQSTVEMDNPYQNYKFDGNFGDAKQKAQFERSWSILNKFGQIIDQNIQNCKKYGLLVPKPMLTPDLRIFPQTIIILSRYTGTIHKIYDAIKTESRLMDAVHLYKVCAEAGIHLQLTREFCFQVVMRLFSKVDKATFVPGIDEDEFLTAIFVCANYALFREPYVLKYKKPEDRLAVVLKQLAEKYQ